jgi:hypothetical protein
MTNNNQIYRMVDTIFESGPIKLNFNVNLIWTLPETEMYEERTYHYWGEYRIKTRPSNANVLVKRKLDYFMTLELKNYRANMDDSIFIPNDIQYKFITSIRVASEKLFGLGQNIFVMENDHMRINNNLPVVVDNYPRNKIFKVVPTIINGSNYQQPGATLIVGNVDCMADITDSEFIYLANMLSTFNGVMYANSMLASLGQLEGPVSAPMDRVMEFKHQNTIRKGRTFAGKKEGII